MKIFFLTLALLMAAQGTFANDAAPSAPNYYQQILNLFEQGSLPSSEELSGVWTGRCYLKQMPSTPFGMGLFARNVVHSPTENNGPLFPPPSPTTTFNFSLANKGGINAAGDLYDNPSAQDKEDMLTYLRGETFVNAVVTTENSSLVSFPVGGDLKYVLRKSGNYFVTEVIEIKDNNKTFKVGDIFANCYFFRKILE